MEILEQLYRALHKPLIPFTAFGENEVPESNWEVRLGPSIKALDLEVRQRQGLPSQTNRLGEPSRVTTKWKGLSMTEKKYVIAIDQGTTSDRKSVV